MSHDPEGNQNSGVRDWKNLKSWADFFLNSAIGSLNYSFLKYIDVKPTIANFDDIALFKFCGLSRE